jgi:hypothetical protein
LWPETGTSGQPPRNGPQVHCGRPKRVFDRDKGGDC